MDLSPETQILDDTPGPEKNKRGAFRLPLRKIPPDLHSMAISQQAVRMMR